MQKAKSSTRKLTTLAMLSALGVVLAATIHFSIIPAAPFLEYDPADIPIFIGSFLFGPLAGLGLTVAVSIIQGVTVSAGGGIIGIIMHILSTGSFCIVTGIIYKRKKSRKNAAIALFFGTITMTIVMVFCNLIFTPIFLGTPIQAVIELLLPAIIPFNLIKASLNSIITFLIYKPISKIV